MESDFFNIISWKKIKILLHYWQVSYSHQSVHAIFFKFSRLTPHQHRPHPLPPPRSQCPIPLTTPPQVGTEPSHSSNVVIERHLYIVIQHKKIKCYSISKCYMYDEWFVHCCVFLSMSCLELHKIDKALLEQSSHPTNLLVTFLEYSSIVMQDTKGQA